MIRIKAKYYPKEELTRVMLKHKHSCTAECLAVIHKIMNEIENYSDTPRKEIYKLLKEMDKENAH